MTRRYKFLFKSRKPGLFVNLVDSMLLDPDLQSEYGSGSRAAKSTRTTVRARIALIFGCTILLSNRHEILNLGHRYGPSYSLLKKIYGQEELLKTFLDQIIEFFI